MTAPDFGETAKDYACYRAGFPESFFGRLQAFGVGVAGQAVVDFGTGTGTLARGFARRGCRVIGVDLSEAMLAEARRLSDEQRLVVEFRRVRAEETGLPTASVDAVTAGQCWHWFERPRSGAEARRLLKPGGAIVIAHFDWIPLPGNVVDATEHLIERHNSTWKLGGAIGLYPQWVHDVDVAGFQHIETFSYDVTVPYTHLTWRGRVRASAGVGASLPADKVREFDRALAEMLAAQFPFDALEVPHRVFAVVARSPSGRGMR